MSRLERVDRRNESFTQDVHPQHEEGVLSRRGDSTEINPDFIERSKRTLQVGIRKVTPHLTKKTSA